MLRHEWSSVNPKVPMSHLSLSPCTGSRLQLALSSRHWCLHIEQPQAQHPPTSTYYYESTSPPEVWDLRATPRGAITERHKIIQIVFIHRFKAGRMNFPPLSGMLNLWQCSSNTWKLISSIITWLHLKKTNKQKKNTCSLSLTSPYPASICLEQCLELCITSTSCVWMPLYNVSLILFLNRKSL